MLHLALKYQPLQYFQSWIKSPSCFFWIDDMSWKHTVNRADVSRECSNERDAVMSQETSCQETEHDRWNNKPFWDSRCLVRMKKPWFVASEWHQLQMLWWLTVVLSASPLLATPSQTHWCCGCSAYRVTSTIHNQSRCNVFLYCRMDSRKDCTQWKSWSRHRMHWDWVIHMILAFGGMDCWFRATCLGVFSRLFRGLFVALMLGTFYAYSPWKSLLMFGHSRSL